MRVIAGRARGTKLLTFEGLETRPTLDRVKESLFSSIQYELRGRVVLDAFAGSGALGIEALSRGALKADFCERDEKAFEVLKKNVLKTHFLAQSGLHRMDVLSYLNKASTCYDLVFLDPPYERGYVFKVLAALVEKRCLSNAALIVVEAEKGLDLSELPEDFTLRKKKDYSSCSLSIYDYRA